MHWLWVIIIGFLAGAIAKLFIAGPGGFIVTKARAECSKTEGRFDDCCGTVVPVESRPIQLPRTMSGYLRA